MPDGLRVGVIGVGLVGRLHIAAYQKAGARVVAVADLDTGSMKALGEPYRLAQYTDYAEMLAREDLQAISVCTPPAMHLPAAVGGAQRGLAVLCEKPLAESTASAHALAEAVTTTGVPFMVGFFHRFHEPLVRLRELIGNGTLGRPIVVRSRFSLISTSDQRPWVLDPAIAGGGTMMNSAVHSMDIVRYLTQGEASARGSVISYGRPQDEVEDTAIALLTGEHGDLAIVEAYGAAPFRTYELWAGGSRGEAIVSWDPPGLRLRLEGQREWEEVPGSASTALERIDRGVAYFCSCVEGGRPIKEATVLDGLRALELAQSAYRLAGRQSRTGDGG